MISEQRITEFGFWIVVLTVMGTVLLPSIEVSPSIPRIELSDVSFSLLGVLLLMLWSNSMLILKKYKSIFISFSLIVVVASLSILFNGRLEVYRDWFEPIKLLKLEVLLLSFIAFVNPQRIKPIVKVSFVILICINILHYFNIFGFNEWGEVYFAPGHHLDFFGLNSIGGESTKRMLGTLGNPNNNAILFLLFLIYFLPLKSDKFQYDQIYAVVAIVGILACQSRTGFLAMLIVLVMYVLIYRIQLKYILLYAVFIMIGFWLMKVEGNSYISSIGNAEVMASAKKGRFAQWQAIIDSMPGYWPIGHGVNKAYFEQHGIYAESEYFLILFRYGLIGIISFLTLFITISSKGISFVSTKGGMVILGVLLILIVTGITNSPFHVVKLSVFSVFLLGFGLNLIDAEKN